MSVANTSTNSSLEHNTTCRRADSVDRRKAHFKATLFSYFNSRRLQVRRSSATTLAQLTDSAKSHSYGLMTGILLFLIFDAILSYSILSSSVGAENVLTHVMTNNSWQTFFLVKSILAAISIIFLAGYKNIKMLEKLSVLQVIVTFVSVYFFMLTYEIALVI
ncbi:MAG: hypothetical protein OEX19_08990 [Gammaproteobacteria bacterium]|nr:hypothetical protein [Gammaproteobacteria bacterium]